MNRSILRIRATVVAVVFASLLACPTYAFAENGSITVSPSSSSGSSYQVFRIFNADINDGSAEENGGVAMAARKDEATHVSWNAAARDATLSFLDANGYAAWRSSKGLTQSGARENAQNAADYIAQMINASASASEANTTPPTKTGASFASALARALALSVTPTATLQAGNTFEGPEGYYLLVSNADSIGNDVAGTAPLWIALGGSVKTIAPKSAVPALTKHVKGVGDADYRQATDSFTGQDVQYRITGTLPSNFKAFASYRYKIEDTMTGMELAQGGVSEVSVAIDGQDVTADIAGSNGSIAYANGILTIDFADLVSFPHTITPASSITVTYRAHNIAGAAANRGGTNTAKLTYTADPVSGSTSQTAQTSPSTHAYSYCLNLLKRDKSNGSNLEGAVFTVKLSAYAQDTALQGLYVQADGSLNADPYKFRTGSDGAIAIPGIDAGTYIIAETGAPSGYEVQDADMTVTLGSTINAATGSLEDLSATLTGGEAVDVEGDERSRITSVDVSSGAVNIQAVDDRTFKLANTGLQGNAALYFCAVAIGTVGAVGYLTTSRKPRRDETEES